MRYLFLIIFLLGSVAYGQFTPPGSADLKYKRYAPGDFGEYVFIDIFRFISPSPRKPTNFILDKDGNVVWYHQSSPWMIDFRLQENGQLTFNQNNQFYVLDSTFSLVDSMRCDGYNTDTHDILLTADDRIFMVCYEDSTMDLRSIYTRNGTQGDSAAYVLGNVIQELAPDKTSLKTWHTFDHFDISDADSLYWTTPAVMELNHTNSIDLDENGRMLMSHRSNNELTMIDWDSGDILWRFSGANNEFAMPNDIGLSGQHFARILPGDEISVFDNGAFHPTIMSRGVIYDMDTVNMVATKTWEYSRSTARSNSLGSFKVLPNGNRLINWGAFTPGDEVQVSLVAEDSTLLMEMDFKDSYWTYRAHSMDIPFSIPQPEIVCSRQDTQLILGVAGNHSSYMWSDFETTPNIMVTDTGWYQVFVPLGIGMVGSVPMHITDLDSVCPLVATQEVTEPIRRRKLLGVYDILGRQVWQRNPGELYIERYDDGTSRKVMWIE